MRLRTRLAWTYGFAILFAVAIVAIVSFTAIDGTLRSSLDSRLTTTASAVAALVDVRDAHLRFDAEDRGQMHSALASVMSGAIFNADGSLFFSSTPSIPASISAAVRSAGLADPATLFDGRTQLRAVCRPIARGTELFGRACVWESDAYIGDVDRSLIAAIALAAIVAGGIAALLSSALAQRALAPLQAFSDLATEIEAHDLSRRVRHGGDDELGRLGSAFDRMLDRLESAFARQRRFTADASHELRAPLAVIRAEADASLEGTPTRAQYEAALHTIVAEVERIDAIVDALLLAARADSARLHLEPVDLVALASVVAERFGNAAAHRGITIDVRGEACSTCADPASLERALSAIVHNALDFAASRVELRVTSDGAHAVLYVLDDGPGFSDEGLARATQRFWRGDRRERNGTGLGLAIAETIASAHRGSLRLANRSEGGGEVAILLPRSS